MRIAVVHSFYRDTMPSGENAVVMAQVNTLQNAGNDVLLVDRRSAATLSSYRGQLRAGVAAAGIHGPSPLQAIEPFRPDIIHVHNLFPNFGWKWTAAVSAPIVSTIHNYRAVCARASLFRDGHMCTECIDRGSYASVLHACYRDSRPATLPLAWATRRGGRANLALANSTKIVTLNPHAASLYSEAFGDERVVELPNFAAYPNSTPRVSAQRSGFVYLGRLSEEKGVRWLLNNWPSNEQLTIAGDGPLRGFVEGWQGKNRNVIYLGNLDNKDVLELVASAIAVIIPSMWLEGIPTTALESYSMRTPLLISNRCAAVHRLAQTPAAVVFDPGDGHRGLTEALTAIRADHEARSEAAWHMYETGYSPDVWIRRIASVYKEALRLNPRKQQA